MLRSQNHNVVVFHQILPDLLLLFQYHGRLICFCYSNTMVGSFTTTSTATNHQHCTIPSTPITPKPNEAAALNVATTTVLFKTCGRLVLTVVYNRTASTTLVTCPHFSITKTSITCDFVSECVPVKTVRRGL